MSDFEAVARAVYANDPNWPGDKECTTHGEVFCTPGKNRLKVFIRKDLACFGLFETLGDPDADRALFEQAEDYARSQGATQLYGPIDGTTYGRYRLRTDHFETPPFSGEPYNPPYYPTVLERAGYVADVRYVTKIVTMDAFARLREILRPVHERVLAAGYRIETLNPATWIDRLDELHQMADAVFGSNFGYQPLSWAQFQVACGEAFIHKADDTSVMCFDAEGRIAGFFLGYSHGRHVINKTTGVRPEHRKRGLMEAMSVELYERQKDRYDYAVGAMMREDNPSRVMPAKIEGEERWYALYRKRL